MCQVQRASLCLPGSITVTEWDTAQTGPRPPSPSPSGPHAPSRHLACPSLLPLPGVLSARAAQAQLAVRWPHCHVGLAGSTVLTARSHISFSTSWAPGALRPCAGQEFNTCLLNYIGTWKKITCQFTNYFNASTCERILCGNQLFIFSSMP